MTQRLTVHVGAMKTGSSAIQTFLNRNAEVLRRDGIVVPDENLELVRPVTGDQVFFFDQRRDKSSQDAGADILKRLSLLFSDESVRQVVISAENLAEPEGVFARWFEVLGTSYETEVIIYLRRQDNLLISAWQQWFAKVSEDIWDDFWSWLLTCVGVLGNWQTVLQHWERAVGRERMRVRLYEPRHLIDGDVVDDFRQYLLMTDEQQLAANGHRVNASFCEAIVDLVPGGGFFRGAHDDAFYLFLEWMLGDTCHRRPHESPITYRQRLAILERYAESNRWVRANYFDGQDLPETLFDMPTPEQYRKPTREELTREQLQIMGRLVFEVGKEQFRSMMRETPNPEERWW